MVTFITKQFQRSIGMRGAQPDEDTLYECIDCGDRQTDPEGRLCSCGGYLKNIGVSRGL